MDISSAYSKEAAVNSWLRSYTLTSTGELIIEDIFQLAAAKAATQVNFMTWAKPDISHAGIVLIEKEGRNIKMNYDAALFDASVEIIPQADPRLSKVWGDKIYRVTLTANKRQLKGRYKFIISK